MASIELPHRLVLDELPISTGTPRNGGLHGVEIVIGDKVGDLIDSIRKAGVAHVSLGKRPAFAVDNHENFNFQIIQRPRCFVYRGDPGSDDGDLRLAGVFNLLDPPATKTKLVAAETLDLNDPALLSLQQSLAEHAQKKQANTTVFVKDSSQLPPAKSGRQAIQAAKAAKQKTRSQAFLNPHRQGLFDRSGSRSTPPSPSLAGTTPQAHAKPSREDNKQDALRIPLVHLLAVRPVSGTFITKTLNCNSDDIKGLLEKYGRQNRLNPEKYDLSDRGYKDLDVWKFPYRDPEDRDAAVENAISAFDRQRISTSENVWQILLPKDKRGKGVILSRLKLHTEPVPRARTPKIQVESASEPRVSSKPKPSTNEERPGRLSPNPAVPAPSSSGSPNLAKKSKTSEKEAQAKRLLSKNPKKQPAAAPPKAPASSPPTPAKKDMAKKVVSTTSVKVKSAEFIHDSDDEDDLPPLDEPLPKVPSKRPDPAKTSNPPSKPEPNAKATPAPKATTAVKKAAPPAAAAPRKTTGSENAAKSSPIVRQVSQGRKDSSPMKPSPLGSSPPTNASDLENDNPIRSSKSSSSSNSPLINQRRDVQSAAKKPVNGFKPSPSEGPDKARKRKASELDPTAHGSITVESNGGPAKRRQSQADGSSISSGASVAVPGISKEDIDSSLQFKKMQMRYADTLQELRAHPNPPLERVEKLRKMHAKLSEHKASLWRLAAV